VPSYDYFCAELRCPVCGEISKVQEQTKIGAQEMECLRVGDDIGATVEDVRSFYAELHTPEPDGPIHIMIMWRCHNDHSLLRDRTRWAVVTLEKGKITSIRDVHPDRQLLETIHFVDDDADWAVNRHFGRRLNIGHRALPDGVELLAEAIRRDEEA
jgi:hypothetical protein